MNKGITLETIETVQKHTLTPPPPQSHAFIVTIVRPLLFTLLPFQNFVNVCICCVGALCCQAFGVSNQRCTFANGIVFVNVSIKTECSLCTFVPTMNSGKKTEVFRNARV